MIPVTTALFVAASLAAPLPQDPERAFVTDGRPVAVIERGEAWKHSEDGLTGAGTGTLLLADRALGPGDFDLSATLTIEELDGTAASLVLGGSHVGFDGRGGGMFVEGPLFGGRTREPDRSFTVPEARPFTVTVRRRGQTLSIDVDGDAIHEADIADAEIGCFGLRPWRSTMRVHEFSARGDLRPLPDLTGPFTSGEGGYHTYRIPAVVVTKAGTLLAFCEGRKTGASDSGDIDLLLRRSTDLGQTFAETQVVWDDGPNTCGNPCPVVDHETGAIHLLMTHNLGHDHEGEIIRGESEGTRTVWITSSLDDGETWSEPRDITSQTKRADWSWYATGPGNGIQLRTDPHRGRLVIPCDHIESGSRRYLSHVILSDDGGATWSIGGSSPTDQVNECAIAELSDGRLLLNMRNYDRQQRSRAVCISRDGGESFVDFGHDETLIEPICQAALIRVRSGSADDRRLVFSNPASATGRVAMTLRLSEDDGKTWTSALELSSGPSAYSSLCVLPDGRIGCLFEGGLLGAYESLVFRIVGLDEFESTR